MIIQKGLPQRTLPLCLTVKLNCLSSELCPTVDDRHGEINTPLLAILDICRINDFFTLLPHLPTSLI